MTTHESVQGLTCPNCGGVVAIPEGQTIVRCPYCDLRSLVRGERGLRRYAASQQVPREGAVQAWKRFLHNWAIARDTPQRAEMTEAFLVHLPFWTVWGRVAGWAFGEKKVGSGDDAHYEPREVRIVQEITWNGAACDVGEFGVTQVPLGDQGLDPFVPDELHRTGMVFEPVNSFSDAQTAAENQFTEQFRRKTGLDRISQLFVRTFRRRFGLVYYPLWVLRYLYRGREFQVVVDACSGKVLYGKAPGNTLYRAAVLVGGMAAGAILAIDVPAFLVSISDSSKDSSGLFWAALFLFVAGLGVMFTSYRKFRFGEQYEYYQVKPPKEALTTQLGETIPGLAGPLELISEVKDVEKWVSRLS